MALVHTSESKLYPFSIILEKISFSQIFTLVEKCIRSRWAESFEYIPEVSKNKRILRARVLKISTVGLMWNICIKPWLQSREEIFHREKGSKNVSECQTRREENVRTLGPNLHSTDEPFWLCSVRSICFRLGGRSVCLHGKFVNGDKQDGGIRIKARRILIYTFYAL